MIDTYVLDGSTCFLHKVSPGIWDPASAVQVRAVLVSGGHYMVIVEINVGHGPASLGEKKQHPDAGSASVMRWNVQQGEPTVLCPWD